jgi:hypothetical protein
MDGKVNLIFLKQPKLIVSLDGVLSNLELFLNLSGDPKRKN